MVRRTKRCLVYAKLFTAQRACISFCLHKETLYMTRRLTESNSTAVNSHALVAVDRFCFLSFSCTTMRRLKSSTRLRQLQRLVIF